MASQSCDLGHEGRVQNSSGSGLIDLILVKTGGESSVTKVNKARWGSLALLFSMQ